MPLGVASQPSTDDGQPRIQDRLMLETRRRSAAYHLREFLNLRREIWAEYVYEDTGLHPTISTD